MLWTPPELLPFMKWGLPRADNGGGLGGDSRAGGQRGGFYPCRGRQVPSPVTVLPAARLFFSIKSQNLLSYGSSPLQLFSRSHHLSQQVFLPRVQCRPPLCRFCFTSLSKANHVRSLLLSVLFLGYRSAVLHSTWWRTAMFSFLTLLGNTGVLFSNPHLWAVSCTSLGWCTDGRPAETETTRPIHTGHRAVRRW